MNKIYNVGAYSRLSKEDDRAELESSSIATQKALLSEYVRKQGWRLVKSYADDGYSGISDQRPAFQEMLQDIKAGLIDCVVTKDLSRLGRNYLDCGLYLEVFFPEHNVRYIAVNDGVDTLNRAAMDIAPFRNILNEMYSADVSMKIKSAYRARFQQGKFMGTHAPYGYLKDPADHNHLVIDEAVAPVIRKIFSLAMEGWGIVKIRHWINTQNILRPAAYQVEQGILGYERYFEDNEENRTTWSENSVRMILRGPVYAGHLTGYKRPAVSMKSRKRPSRLPEEWETVQGTHVGIVSQEDFDTVQELVTGRRGKGQSGYDNIFSGIIKCADCGYHLSAGSANRRKRPEILDCVVYSCGNYTRYGNLTCSSHSLEARDLHNAVLEDINHFADMALHDPKALKTIQQRLSAISTGEVKALERERRKLAKRLAELDRLFSALYEDKVMEAITERNYVSLSAKYEKEQLEAVARLQEIDAELAAKGHADRGAEDFLALIQGYAGITELTAAILNALIDKIVVSERYRNAEGALEQKLTIHYKFVGNLHEHYIEVPKRITHMEERRCTRCNEMYLPNSNIARYCPECRKVVAKETARRADAVRKAKRGNKALDPKPCECCGVVFKPKSHNSRFCLTCAPVARKLAAQQWSKEYYQGKKARTVA